MCSGTRDRLHADPTITVAMMEDDIEKWLDQQCESKCIVDLLSGARRYLGHKLSPATCLQGILSIKDLLFIFLQRHPNAVVPRLRLRQAIINAHKRRPLYAGGKKIEVVAEEARQIIRCAMAKVRRGR